MTFKTEAYNRGRDFPHYRFDPSTSRSFVAFNRRVTLTDEPAGASGLLRVEYGDRSQTIPVKRPPALGLPDLGAYAEWVKVLEICQVERTPASPDSTDTVARDKPGTGRLVLVVRRPAEGFDPETWGTARVDDWTFDFHEFEPDGSIRTTAFRWPRSDHGEAKLQKQVGGGDLYARALAAIPPLEERTWEYQAALHVIPKLNVPKYRFQNDAFSPRVMGWTLPVGMLSVLGMLVGLGMALGRRAAENTGTKDPDVSEPGTK